MPNSLTIGITLGSKNAGITLGAHLFNTDATPFGDTITSGFAEIDNGYYVWKYDNFPIGFEGGVRFFNMSEPTKTLAMITLTALDFVQSGNIQILGGGTNETAEQTTVQPSEDTKVINITTGSVTSGTVVVNPKSNTITDTVAITIGAEKV